MKKYHLNLLTFLVIIFSLSSCRTSAPSYNYKELARASIKLGIDIELNDNHQLYVETSDWIGVPYRWSGNNKHGIDCSGFTYAIYNKVYRKKLERSTNGQKEINCARVSKRNLREGDLVFFSSNESRKKVAHVGIYLKNDKFIHASTTRGVIVNDLNEEYYLRHWLSGGRVK